MHKSEKCEQNSQLNGFKKVNYSNIQKSGILRKGFASLHQDGTIVIRQWNFTNFLFLYLSIEILNNFLISFGEIPAKNYINFERIKM